MSSPLGLDNALELLDRLRTVVQSCAVRADQLERELSLSAARLDWQIDNEIKELEQRLSASILELETLLQTRKAQLEFGRDRRKARIARAHASAKKRRLKLLESREGRQINEVQQELLQTSRNRDAQLEFADQTHADNQDALAREEQALASLERRTRSAFRGDAYAERSSVESHRSAECRRHRRDNCRVAVESRSCDW